MTNIAKGKILNFCLITYQSNFIKRSNAYKKSLQELFITSSRFKNEKKNCMNINVFYIENIQSKDNRWKPKSSRTSFVIGT